MIKIIIDLVKDWLLPSNRETIAHQKILKDHNKNYDGVISREISLLSKDLGKFNDKLKYEELIGFLVCARNQVPIRWSCIMRSALHS